MRRMIEPLRRRIADLETEVSLLRDRTTWREEQREAIYSPGDTGHLNVETEGGRFIVALKELTPYANGYKAKFDVGNANLATYENAMVKVSWSSDRNKFDVTRTVEFRLTKPL